jgi:stearoyl-CoA desaturase (Delta-9 desaturase)
MLFNSMSNQTSIYHWCKDHRVHHKHSETEADPHNATRGFFFAHMGWLWLKKSPAVVKAGKEMDFSDLMDDPVVRFQHMVDPWFAQYMCFVLPTQVCVYGWGENWWTAFLLAGCCRYLYIKHCTFLVNSAAHLYGDHPYDVMSYPAENPVVSWFAIGEGWHNWHHKYPYDYSCSEYGPFVQHNPTRLVIDCLAAVGLVWGRKTGTAAWARGRARRDRDLAEGIPLPKQSARPWDLKRVD